MASTDTLRSEIDKCISQLNDRAPSKTILRAKKVVLKHVCREYCNMTQDEVDNLRNKNQLYSAAAAWVGA